MTDPTPAPGWSDDVPMCAATCPAFELLPPLVWGGSMRQRCRLDEQMGAVPLGAICMPAVRELRRESVTKTARLLADVQELATENGALVTALGLSSAARRPAREGRCERCDSPEPRWHHAATDVWLCLPCATGKP